MHTSKCCEENLEDWDGAKAERIIMQWAADNPEPRYPTWRKWHNKNNEQSIIPKLCDALLADSHSGELRITYEEFRNEALIRFGEFVACTSRELTKKISELAPSMKRAGILVLIGKPVGHGRGMFIKRVPPTVANEVKP